MRGEIFDMRFIIALSVLAFAALLPLQAQLPDFLTGNNSKPEVPVEKAPEIRDQLRTWQQETKQQIARLEGFLEEADLPTGITLANLTSRRRLLDQTQLAIDRHFRVLDAREEAAGTLSQAQATASQWQKFDTPPPYSILMVDELLNRRDSTREKLDSHESSIELFKSSFETIFRDATSAQEAVSAALARFDVTGGEDQAEVWKLETARANQRHLFIRASLMQTSIAQLEDLRAADNADLALLERQIRIASKDATLGDADIEQITKASSDRQAGYRKEISAIRKRLGEAVAALPRASAAHEKVMTDESASAEDLALAALRLESANVRIDTLQAILDSYEYYSQLESFVPESYETRRSLLTAGNAAERAEFLANLGALKDRLDTWKSVVANLISVTSADISKQETRASLLPANDPRLVPLNEMRDVLFEYQNILQRASQTVAGQRQLINRWVDEHTVPEQSTWFSKLGNTFNLGVDGFKKIWSIPITSYEEIRLIDGQPLVDKRYVTLGDVLVAVLLFTASFLVASAISRRLQRILIHRKLIGEAQAKTLRNWLMLIVGIVLAVITLSWLNIPLTVFAFLAGALAIGVGFGTQTIIKNFISGIILLFERKIRVGDVLNVDGMVGTISEINTRSSIVRGFDGVENLIPNSVFLENRVINWTLTNRRIRRELRIGVAYGTSPPKVIEILTDCADRHGLVIKDPAPLAVFDDFGASSLDFRLLYWLELNDKTNSLTVASDLRIMIDKRLHECGIGIPFPQQDTHIDTSSPIRVELSRAVKTKPDEDGK